MKDKTDYDCPICRKDSMMRIKIPPNPVLVFAHHDEPRPVSMVFKVATCLVVTVGAILLVIAIVFWG
jgi:hypothetical protein